MTRAFPLVGTPLLLFLCAFPASGQDAAVAPTAPLPQPAPVQFERTTEVGGRLPESARQYAAISAERLMQFVEEIVDISRRYRDSGHPRFWGRILGTESDVWNAEWLMDRYREFGLADVRSQPIDMSPQWMPRHWTVTAAGGGRTLELVSAQPTYAAPGTTGEGLDLEAVYVGMGSDAELELAPDVRGKAVFFYSADLNSRFASISEEAFRRISERGAAAVFGIIGLPGNARVQMYPVNSTAPSFVVGREDGLAVRDLIGAGDVRVRVRLDVEMVPDLRTATVWGTLPGATDETIYIVAHRDGWFDGAVDNASGMATLLALAEYYSGIPQAERRRTVHFIGSSGHHTSGTGVSGEWFAARPDLFRQTALIMNCEHTGARQTFHGSLRLGNAPILMRWFAHDARMAGIVREALDTFGIGTFRESDPRGIGEAGRYYHYAPMAQLLGDGGRGGWYAFHTDQETLETVSPGGLEANTRAYAMIIDAVNKLDLDVLRASLDAP